MVGQERLQACHFVDECLGDFPSTETVTDDNGVCRYYPLALRWALWNHAAMGGDFEFEAVIQAGDGGGAFVFFPFDMQESFGTKGKVGVQATVDGVIYNGKLLKYGFPHISSAC